MHWGHKIIVAYLVFVVVLVILAFKSFQSDVSLVSQDYYRQELVYQSQIERIENERSLKEKIHIELNSDTQALAIHFPKSYEEVKGTVKMYRPSDADLDQQFALSLDTLNYQHIPVHELASGLWKLQISWESLSKSYYKEHPIYLP